MKTKEKIEFARLPLAVYQELAAHLRQVKGVGVDLIPQKSQQFDYDRSQISGLWIEYTETSSPQSRERVEQVLAYYQNRYRV